MNIIKQLREQAEEISKLGHSGWGNTMTFAADQLELYEAQLWAINDELVKAGLKPMEYNSFSECIAVLRKRAQQANGADAEQAAIAAHLSNQEP